MKSERTRYIKTVIFNSINVIDGIEAEVNLVIESIKDAGGKIVSIVPHNYGISPMHLIYNIIYENDHMLTDKELKGKQDEKLRESETGV